MPFCFCRGPAPEVADSKPQPNRAVQPALADLLRVLLGNAPAWDPRSNSSLAPCAQFNSISVSSELSSEHLASTGTLANVRLMDVLEPYLYDALRRRLGLEGVAGILGGFFDAADTTNLVSALAMTTENKRRLYRLLSRNVGLPLPWLHTVNGELVDSGEGLNDLLTEGGFPLILVHVLTKDDTARKNVGNFLHSLLPRQFPLASTLAQTSHPGLFLLIPAVVARRTLDDAVVLVVDNPNLAISLPNLSSYAAASLIFLDERLSPKLQTDAVFAEKVAVLVGGQSPGAAASVFAAAGATAALAGTAVGKRLASVPGFGGVQSLSDAAGVRRLLGERLAKSESLPLCPSISVLRGSPTTSRPKDFVHLLDQTLAQSGGRVKSTNFPFTKTYERQLWLQKRERTLREQGGLEALQELNSLQQELAEIAKQISACCQSSDGGSGVSRLLGFFCETQLLKPSPDFSIYAMARHLDSWRQRNSAGLLQQRREALEQQRSSDEALKQITSRLDEIDGICMDTFWTELECMLIFFGQDNPAKLPVPKELIQQRYAESVLDDGFPLQLLKGKPLHIVSSDMLKGVLGRLSNFNQGAVYVVSVIGAQSSAKSTLLNFLFGCEFETRSGRCTKGLYCSVLSRGQDTIVVLDSEGLLSVEAQAEHAEFGGSEVFDGQMTLLAMACSHLVLINHKGEISRQLQDLLEVCMFAMQHLRVTHGIGPAGGDAVYQPLVNFVLRDQHDRSSSVHEDTLRHMRRHLVECGDRVGLKVEEVIRIESGSVFLLPAAFVGGQVDGEFSKEVLRLRNKVMGQLGKEVGWSSLDEWVSHVNTVWETLTLFGHNLLHYRTIQEIELRKELEMLAGDLVKELVDGEYKKEADALLEQTREQLISAATSAARLTEVDLQLCSLLASLKDKYRDKLTAAFDKNVASSRRFPVSLRESVKEKTIANAMDFPSDNVLYSWKLLLRTARDGEQISNMWKFFADQFALATSGVAGMAEADAAALFDKEWLVYEAECLRRLEAVRKDRTGIAYEVSVLFNRALAKVTRERPDFAVLKDIGPVFGDGQGTMLTEAEDAWKAKYVKVAATGAAAAAEKEVGRDLRTLKTLVSGLVGDVESEVQRQWLSLGEATVVEWLRRGHDIVTSEGERRVRTVTIKRPQMLDAVHLQLRHSVVATLWSQEEGRHLRHLEEMRSLKTELKDQLVLLARNNASDLDRAKVFALRYHTSILQWLDFTVTSFATEVRAVVLAEMPDTAKAHERAFQSSFGARNWMDVLEYCLDVNCYLEKLFLQLFWRRQVVVVNARQGLLEGRLAQMYASLKAAVADWQRVPAQTGAAGERVTVSSLHEFLLEKAGKGGGSLGAVSGVFPQTVNFEVRDKQLFGQTLNAELSRLFGDDFPNAIEERVRKALSEQSVEAWSLLKGCSGRCPLCGSKCDRIGEHNEHHCGHHLLPGFHGWMERVGGKSLLNMCYSEEVHNGTYQCRDGVWRPLAEYLQDSHANWCPFPKGAAADGRQDDNLLKAAWVNVKKALEKYFKPMKAVNPPEWDCFVEPDRQLTEADLETAKKTVKLLRAKKYTPQHAGIVMSGAGLQQ